MKKITASIPLFNFYEIVRVASNLAEHSEINMKFGVVLGMSENQDGDWIYSIEVCNDTAYSDPNDSWSIAEPFLAKTGRNIDPDTIYSGESIKVSPSGNLT